VQPAPLAAHRAAVAAAEPGERLVLVAAVVGVHQPHDRRALELVVLAPGERAQCPVDLQEAPVDGGDGHADRRVLERGPEAGLGLRLRALGLGARVDVADRGVDLGEPGRVADGQQPGLGPAPGAVGAAQPDRDGHGILAAHQAPHGGHGGGRVAGVDEVGAARAGKRDGREVEQLAAVLGDVADDAVGPDGGQDVARVVGQLARACVGRAAGGLGAVARLQGIRGEVAAAAGVDAQPGQPEAGEDEPGGQRSGRSGERSDPEQQQQSGQRGESTEEGSSAAVARGHPPLVGFQPLRLKCRVVPPPPAPAT
jgi:hypothetical protein